MARRGKKMNLRPTNQYATIVESREFNDVLANTPYTNTFFLGQFYRATTVAPNFAFYRAKSVKYEYMPLYNVFQELNQAIQGVGKPQVYTRMNREQNLSWSQASPASSLFAIQSSGADPKAFTKNLNIVYKPNWCSPGITAVKSTAYTALGGDTAVNSLLSMGMKTQYGWLPTPNIDLWQSPGATNPVRASVLGYLAPQNAAGNVVYNGHDFIIEQVSNPGVVVCKLVVTVEWEFKGPKEMYSLQSLKEDGTLSDPPAKDPALGQPTVGLTPGA